MASQQDTKKRLALAIIDFLSTSLKDGTISSEDAESAEVAQQCIADIFHVNPLDKGALEDAIGTQSLLSIYGVYEKLKGKSTASTQGSSSANEARPSTPQTAGGKTSAPPAANPEAEAFKSKGNQAMQIKDYKTAIDFYSKALNLSPLNPIYLSNRAAAYSAANQHAEASTDAEMAVAADPKFVKGWSRLGFARFALGDAKGSVEAYEKGIEYEGNGGSEAMKRGLETARRKLQEESASGAGGESARDMPGGGAGPGGMPDLSALAGMFGGGRGGGGGGGGGPDLSAIMNNPMFASMAQNLMSNPEMLNNIMSNPRLREMAENFGGGGGGGGGGEGGGGMPDVASLMQDPSIAEMARNLMGGRGGGGAGGAGAGRGS